MTTKLTVFERSPNGGSWFARDNEVRRVLAELGETHDTRAMSFAAMRQQDKLMLHPFGQIPALQDGDPTLFKSGWVMLHVAKHYPGLVAQGKKQAGLGDHMDVCRPEHRRTADS